MPLSYVEEVDKYPMWGFIQRPAVLFSVVALVNVITCRLTVLISVVTLVTPITRRLTVLISVVTLVTPITRRVTVLISVVTLVTAITCRLTVLISVVTLVNAITCRLTVLFSVVTLVTAITRRLAVLFSVVTPMPASVTRSSSRWVMMRMTRNVYTQSRASSTRSKSRLNASSTWLTSWRGNLGQSFLEHCLRHPHIHWLSWQLESWH